MNLIIVSIFLMENQIISRCFYTPPIALHCNHQRKPKKIQRNGGTGDEGI